MNDGQPVKVTYAKVLATLAVTKAEQRAKATIEEMRQRERAKSSARSKRRRDSQDGATGEAWS